MRTYLSFRPSESEHFWKVRILWLALTFGQPFKGQFEGSDLVLGFRLELGQAFSCDG